ncbi:FtsX-like permease family protein [Rhodococcus xishaensis]|uniref:FtsX-like permease family protein n=1 Tax=Rhodococcus xishaensis TaxID=2487364 RepID=A0A3S3E3U3_9NOCA|nr:FtsX-like permease family protein [Rhodococcus xishaensis]RVW05231.1 FtsX-like permease family protein [Rhodococcus xishaensis]
MRGLAWAQMRAHAGRYVASVLAVVIAVAFIVATLTLNSTLKAGVADSLAGQYATTDVVVTGNVDAAAVAAVPGVRAATADATIGAKIARPGEGTSWGSAVSLSQDPGLRWQKLADGRYPDALGEVAVGANLGIPVGSQLTVTPFTGKTTTASSATVVGLIDLEGTVQQMNGTTVFGSTEQLDRWTTGSGIGEIRAAGDGTLSQEQLAQRVRSFLPDVTVETGVRQAELVSQQYLGDSDLLASVLLAFGAIAVVVAGLVIANTFAVLLAARTRDLALLRCVGATATQVRSSVRVEAAGVGVVASVLGVGFGIAAAWAVTRIASAADVPIPLNGVTVTPVTVVAGLVVGVVMTMVAASAPGRAATRVSPLAALQPLESAPEAVVVSRTRRIGGTLALLVGIGVLAVSVTTGQVLTACLGGLLTFVAIVVLSQRIVPAVVSGVGALLGRLGGPVGLLAAGNAGRNPRRTAATATALLIGVTLTSTLVVGIAVTRASAPGAVEDQFPVDVSIMTRDSAGLPVELTDAVRDLDGVTAVAQLETAELTLADGHTMPVVGVDVAALRATARNDISLPGPGQLMLGPDERRAFGLAPGDTVTLGGTAGHADLTVGAASSNRLALVDNQTLAMLSSQVTADRMWIRLADGVHDDRLAVQDEIASLAEQFAPGSDIGGSLVMRATLDTVLDTMLLIVAGLLSVAVVIALIGVGNTMALSVLERRRESGLLRALGLTRAGLRSLLLWEALLIAGVASAMGVTLGLVFGITGSASVFGFEGLELGTLPWLTLAAIVLGGGAAGVVAALLPARRAAGTAPIAALA